MSAVLPAAERAGAARRAPMSPNQRAWARFRRHRLGYVSLWVFVAMLVVCTFAELISQRPPLVARYEGEWFLPVLANPPETRFGGDFATPTDWNDPFIREQFAKPGNWALYTLNEHSATSLNYFAKEPDPAPPSRNNCSAPTTPGATCSRGCSTDFASASTSGSR